jgi:hypothetical protein
MWHTERAPVRKSDRGEQTETLASALALTSCPMLPQQPLDAAKADPALSRQHPLGRASLEPLDDLQHVILGQPVR